MRIRLFGTQIYISFLFVALIALMLATDKTGLALPTLFAVVIHEIGHLFCMWLKESTPKSIRLIPASVQITRSVTHRYNNDIAVALSGPTVNLILFCVLYIYYTAFKNQTVLYYALINLIVGCFNLLPVIGLDGGTALFSIIAQKKDVNRAMLTLKIITLSVGTAILLLAVSLTLRGNINISVYIISIYLILSVLIKI